jgi:hypothetical protein
MAHVDALSRNSVQEQGDDSEDEQQVFPLSLYEDDWVLAAKLKDETCKRLHAVLIQEQTDREQKRVHEKYTLKKIESIRWFTMGCSQDGTQSGGLLSSR